MDEQQSTLVKVAKTLERFPGYIAGFLISTLISTLSDPIVTALTIGSIAIGFVTNVFIAVGVFFLFYTAMRMILSIATAIGVSGQQLSYTLAQRNMVNHDSTPDQ